nr:MAG: hypothetical protein DIU78_09595 [Pseudomonadota bacterium]
MAGTRGMGASQARVLRLCEGNVSAVARELGISRQSSTRRRRKVLVQRR